MLILYTLKLMLDQAYCTDYLVKNMYNFLFPAISTYMHLYVSFKKFT